MSRLEPGKGVYAVNGEGAEEFIPADTIVYAMGMRPNTQTVEALRDACLDTVCVGDCVRPGRPVRPWRRATGRRSIWPDPPSPLPLTTVGNWIIIAAKMGVYTSLRRCPPCSVSLPSACGGIAPWPCSGLGACAALTGTVLIRGKLAIHFDGAGIPTVLPRNGYCGAYLPWPSSPCSPPPASPKSPPWGSSPSRRRRQRPGPAWLVTAFSLVDVLLVAYHLFPYAAVQAVGFALIVGTLPLFLLTAFVRNRRSGQPS